MLLLVLKNGKDLVENIITIDNKTLHNTNEIANGFNEFFCRSIQHKKTTKIFRYKYQL